LWVFAAFVVTTDLVARVILVSRIADLANALAALVVLCAVSSIVITIRVTIGRRLGAPDETGFHIAQHFLAWTILPVPAFHATVIWAGFLTSPVIWRHARYVVDKSGRVVAVTRRPHL
jgi:hypothetical protein